jgi:uncharacterized delta-60 repeat protein
MSTIDTSFGTSGKTITDLRGNFDEGMSLAFDASGGILVAGSSSNGTNYDFAMVRYTANGTLDASFGTGGKATLDFNQGNDYGSRVLLDAAGKIVVVGTADNGNQGKFALARYNANGSLDTSFGTAGKVMTTLALASMGTSATIDTNGKILVAGYTLTANGGNDFALVRYNADGSLDTSFGGGTVMTDFSQNYDQGNSIAIDGSGKILVAGTTYNGNNCDFALVRYNADGSLDTSFGNSGKVSTAIGAGLDEARSLSLDTNGRIVVAGFTVNDSNTDFALVRYNANGSLDTSFGTAGKVMTALSNGNDYSNSVTIDGSGRILLAGYADNGTGQADFAIARYTSNGTLDTSFGTGGKLITPAGGDGRINAMKLDASGRIVAAGSASNGSNYDFALLRYANNVVVTTKSLTPAPTPMLAPAGEGTSVDFNRDSNSDIFWYDAASRSAKLWLMDSFNVKASVNVTVNPNAKSQMSGVADFNRDGNADLLWHDRKKGTLQVTLLNEGNQVATVNLPKLKKGWQVSGLADFNWDGQKDIIVSESKSGKTQIWQMSGASVVRRVDLPKHKGKGTIVGTADFNGDGFVDVLWRDQATGKTEMRLIQGRKYSARLEVSAIGATWQVKGVADFNGDAKADILCQDSATGTARVLLLNGTGVAAISDLPGGVQYIVQGAADFDRNGRSEVLWRDRASGAAGVWFMKDLTQLGQLPTWQQTTLPSANTSITTIFPSPVLIPT